MTRSTEQNTTEHSSTEEQAIVSPDDVAFSEVLSAWDKVFQGLKATLRSHSAVVTSDFRLSVKAIIVALICMMTLVCIGLVVWVTLLIGLTYGLTMLGVNWLWCLLIVLAVNFIALVVVRRIFTSALKSIGMKTSAELIFNTTKPDQDK